MIIEYFLILQGISFWTMLASIVRHKQLTVKINSLQQITITILACIYKKIDFWSKFIIVSLIINVICMITIIGLCLFKVR